MSYELTIHTFEMGAPKESAVKVLEEAAESFGAWQEVDCCATPHQCIGCDIKGFNGCYSLVDFEDELADVIQATCNLAVRYGIDLSAAMERCEERNRTRGRYHDGSAAT